MFSLFFADTDCEPNFLSFAQDALTVFFEVAEVVHIVFLYRKLPLAADVDSVSVIQDASQVRCGQALPVMQRCWSCKEHKQKGQRSDQLVCSCEELLQVARWRGSQFGFFCDATAMIITPQAFFPSTHNRQRKISRFHTIIPPTSDFRSQTQAFPTFVVPSMGLTIWSFSGNLNANPEYPESRDRSDRADALPVDMMESGEGHSAGVNARSSLQTEGSPNCHISLLQ